MITSEAIARLRDSFDECARRREDRDVLCTARGFLLPRTMSFSGTSVRGRFVGSLRRGKAFASWTRGTEWLRGRGRRSRLLSALTANDGPPSIATSCPENSFVDISNPRAVCPLAAYAYNQPRRGGRQLAGRSNQVSPPFGTLGWSLGLPWIHRKLRATSDYRHRTAIGDLLVHRRSAQARPMKIVVTGESGLVGNALRPVFDDGWTCGDASGAPRDIRRGRPRFDRPLGPDPRAQLSREGLEGHDAVVHLAGGASPPGGGPSGRNERSSRAASTARGCSATLCSN